MQQTSATGVTTTYAYDALRRQVGVFSESAGGTRSVASVTAYNALGQVESVTDAADNTTLYLYCPATGRRITTVDPLGQATHTAYDLPGRVIATWGATYPVAYEYDPHGRMTAMYTLRDGAVETNFTDYAAIAANLSAFDKTEWQYDLATGLLTNKLYAADNGTTYTYTPQGQLASRTWARGIVTEYAYDGHNQLTHITYSDTTPAATFTYDRLGRQKVVQTFLSAQHFSYDPVTLALTNEMVIANGVTNSIARAHDPLGRPEGLGIAGTDYEVAYAYDPLGRFDAVSVAGQAAQYHYVEGSDLLAGWTNSIPDTGLTRSYEPNRDLLTEVHNQAGGTVSKFAYQNDALGRRTERLDTFSGVVTNRFAYNARSEVPNALMGADSFAWAYDPIGNRQHYTENGTTLD
ncbi:MAG: hypothetical protein K9N49_05470, partial [Candidatus Marinimicrobia bacterium]|nr:hypothetical protein [Candidatus Neomarinimicrobiota bacterium]